MIKDDIFNYFDSSSVQYFATAGLDGKPKVRPFQSVYREGGNIFFCTGAGKDVYAELLRDPSAEVCASTADSWLRIRGTVKWVDSIDAKQKALDSLPLVKAIYVSADNPALKLFFLAEAEGVLADFSGDPPRTAKLN